MLEAMAESWYRLHYQNEISKHLTEEQKIDIAKRISKLTLESAIWLDRDIDYSEQFPELKPYINVELSGMYLCAIMKGIVDEIQGNA